MADPNSIDFHPRSTITRAGSFWKVFKNRSDSVFDRSIARLSVLYEDLYLEVVGAGMEPGRASPLEPFGPQYRHVYFLRRAVATALEVKHAIEQIAHTPEFRSIQIQAEGSREPHYSREWVPAQQFFKREGRLLKTIRDDVGGHFGDRAASTAFRTIDDDYCVLVEVQSDIDGRVRLLLPFATELAAAALFGNVPGKNYAEQFTALLELLYQAVEHTVQAVHFLAETVLLSRLG